MGVRSCVKAYLCTEELSVLVLDIRPKYLVFLIVPTLTRCLILVMYTSVAIFTFVAFERSFVRGEIRWPSWVIIPTGLKEGSEEMPVPVDVVGPGALGNRWINEVGFDAQFLSFF